jgi:alkylhydroperoxidase/carboxymuconolactone decarboxylase family protein YurZ
MGAPTLQREGDALQAKLKENYVLAELLDKLDDTIPNAFNGTGLKDAATQYVGAIGSAFYYDADRRAADSGLLDETDRERCLIALLASRGRTFELAVHIYLGLMAGVSEAEIRHVLFLAGVYAGSDSFNASLRVLNRTLATLTRIAGHPSGPEVLQALSKEFPT